MAEEANWTEEQLALIRSAICKDDLTDEEFALFIETARRKGLDPLQKQVHAIKRWNKNLQKHVMTVQTGIDGYRLIARRDGLAGIDDARFEEGKDYPIKATVTVHRWSSHGQKESYQATAYWDEYYPGDGNQGYFWRKMPHGQLAKVAEALALRKGFQELSGLYITEEMQQSGDSGNGSDKRAEGRPAQRRTSQRKTEAKADSTFLALTQEIGNLANDYRENVGPLTDAEIAFKALGNRKPKRSASDYATIRNWLKEQLVLEEEGPGWMDNPQEPPA
jgi:phage recombination protein Bet